MRFRATLYEFADLTNRWTIDFEARGARAARAWLNGYAGEYGFGIWHDPEEITGNCDLPVIERRQGAG